MPNIEVLKAYSGVLTRGQIVYPGVYAEDDPALVDALPKMIEKGFAVLTDKPIPAPVAPVVAAAPAPVWSVDEDDVIGEEVREEVIPVVVPEDDAPETDLTAFTFTELKELAEAAGLEVVGTGKNGAILKADLVRALEGAEG